MFSALLRRRALCVLLNLELGTGVGNLDVELLRTRNDEFAKTRAHTVGNLGAVLAVVHHEHLQLLGVVHDELVEAIGHQISSLLIRTVSNRWLRDRSLETPTHTRVNTLSLSPGIGLANTLELLVLVALEGLRALLDNTRLRKGSHTRHNGSQKLLRTVEKRLVS